ncbi:major tail protein [Bacillus thuringiensis]|uniref:major tail protein n=1 Tax=Bacillus TaxID=1386 RepID=UPI00066544BE|nr:MULTISPECIES: major tail protein [Bacillus cereus group]MCO4220394.1 phage tail protein [Bacillus sp. 10017]MCR6792075.1 phage tail protein [Bacillus paranthracis]MDM8365087.1 phage tail protein [Bacillus thuringiensis]MED1168921.1 phage tail protein [Bacillus paranthracis]WAI27859.1 MAG: phage tail protein [Bacillus paranthracis]
MAGEVIKISSTVGVDSLVYAKSLKDDATGVDYSTVKKMEGAVKVKLTKKVSSEVMWSDNRKSEIAESDGETEVEIELRSISLSTKADIEGFPEVKDGVLDEKREGEKPYLAIGFRFLKANGKYRYVWLLKGKLSQEEEEAETKKDKPNFQTTKLKGSFIERDFDDRTKFTADEDEPTFTKSVGDNWFNKVYEKPVAQPPAGK